MKNQSGSLAQISQAKVAKWAKEIGVFKIETPKLIISFREQLFKADTPAARKCLKITSILSFMDLINLAEACDSSMNAAKH